MSKDDAIEAEHGVLLRQIARDAADSASWTGRASLSERVMTAMARVSRSAFVPVIHRLSAYENRPLPIGHGQTISQPFIVAIMTDLLDLGPEDRVLEIGTGSGYQAAVLAGLAREVFSLEVIPDLAAMARQRLARLGYDNVRIATGDGFRGWPEEAPFDAIIVTAAPPDFPPALDKQLAAGGRLVIPVGPREEPQMLWRCVKGENGTILRERKLPVAFVPMLPGA